MDPTQLDFGDWAKSPQRLKNLKATSSHGFRNPKHPCEAIGYQEEQYYFPSFRPARLRHLKPSFKLFAQAVFSDYFPFCPQFVFKLRCRKEEFMQKKKGILSLFPCFPENETSSHYSHHTQYAFNVIRRQYLACWLLVVIMASRARVQQNIWQLFPLRYYRFAWIVTFGNISL